MKSSKSSQEECGGRNDRRRCSPEMPFGDWLYILVRELTPSPRSVATTQDDLRKPSSAMHIIPEIGSIPLNKLTQNDLQQFYGRLKKKWPEASSPSKYGEGLSDRMVRMCHATCRSALETGGAGWADPCEPGHRLQAAAQEGAGDAGAGRGRNLQKVPHSGEGRTGYYEALPSGSLATGLRRGELMALQWDDLNFETGVLTVNKQVVRCADGQLADQHAQDQRTPSERSSCRLRWWQCCGSTRKQ